MYLIRKSGKDTADLSYLTLLAWTPPTASLSVWRFVSSRYPKPILAAVMMKKCLIPSGALVIRERKNTVTAMKPRVSVVNQRVSTLCYSILQKC